jgi:hypothetical protein
MYTFIIVFQIIFHLFWPTLSHHSLSQKAACVGKVTFSPAVTQVRLFLLFPYSLLSSVALFVLGSKLQMSA